MKSETSAPGGQSATQDPPVFTGAEDGTGFWHHLSRTASLALPVMLSRAGMVLMLTVDTAIVGHLAFADRGLAAFGAALIPLAVLQTAAIGLLIGVIVRSAQFDGAGKPEACGEVWRLGLILALILGVVYAAIMTNGTRVGLVGQLAPAVTEAHGLPGNEAVYVAEVDLDALEQAGANRSVRIEPLPRYPAVTPEISHLVDATLASADVRRTIRRAPPPTHARVREFHLYQGTGVPESKVSLSLRLTFRSSDRTLTDAEIQAAMDGVLAALKEKHGAIQR